MHVNQARQRQDIGIALLKTLLAASEKEKFWTLTAKNFVVRSNIIESKSEYTN